MMFGLGPAEAPRDSEAAAPQARTEPAADRNVRRSIFIILNALPSNT